MKKLICAVLACALLVSLAACGGEDTASGGSSGRSSSSVVESAPESSKPAPEESEAPEEEPEEEPEVIDEDPAELTLDDGEVRLVYAKGDLLAAIFHGPYKDIGMTFCNPDDGEELWSLFVGYGHPSPGWTMAITYDMNEDFSVDKLGLRVTDYDAPRNADGTYATRMFTSLGEPMTDQELKDVGFDFLDGHCCIVSSGRGTYGPSNFGIMFNISWFCDGYDRESKTIDIDGFWDRFTFFTGDGTPLEEAFEGFSDLQVNSRDDSSVNVLLYTEGSSDKETLKKLVRELMESQPYMIYTDEDGTTHTFTLEDK